MISPDVSKTETVRNVFIIDDKGVIRTILVYPMTTGRFIPEILRIVDSLQFTDKEGLSTPVNWMPEMPGIMPSPRTFSELEQRVGEFGNSGSQFDWYMTFKF